MKTLIRSGQVISRSLVSPFSRAALPLFFALAFLPGIMRLMSPDMPAENPVAAMGCVIAGFWLATSFREIRVNSMLLGSLVTALLWSANWLMMAGGDCCATMMGVH
jgi:hypothetical protein